MCCALRHGRIKAFSLTAAKSSLCHYSVKMYPLYAGHFESQSTVALQLSNSLTHKHTQTSLLIDEGLSRVEHSARGELLFVNGIPSEIWVHIRQRRSRVGALPALLARAHSSPIQHFGNRELGTQISAIAVLSLPTWEALGREEGSLTKPWFE